MAITESIVSLFAYEILGNQIWQFVAFLISLLAVYPLAKIIQWILKKYLIVWAEKTSFKFDDILIKSINPPITMFILAGAFYIGSSFINKGAYAQIFERVLNFLLIIPGVYFMIKFSTEILGFYLKGEKTRGKKINEAAIDLLMSIIRISLFLIGILLVLANLGYNVSALLAGLGVGGLAFALAAQDVLKNFFAGVALIFDKAFAKGERVRFEGRAGLIEEVTLRSTKLRTYDGTVLTIPNAMLADNIVENETKIPKVKVAMTLNMVYGTSSKKLQQAKKLIEEAILEEEKTNKESYWVWFDNFGPHSLDIQVIYFGTLTMNDWPERALFKDRVNFAIKDKFEKAGLEFAFPTQTIELKK